MIDSRSAQSQPGHRRLEAGGFAHARTQILAGDLFAALQHQHLVLDALLDQECVHLGIVLQVTLGLAALGLIERRLGDIEIALVDDLAHLPVEEGEQQRADVGAVDVGIGHDDDAVIAQLLDIEIVAADAGAQRRDQRADLVGRQHLVEARALDVEDLAAQRQHRLVLAVAALFGGTAC